MPLKDRSWRPDLCVLIIVLLGSAVQGGREAHATEGGFGHYVIGAFGAPAAGVVPPEPGVYWLNTNVYYSGSARRSLSVPIGRTLSAGLKIELFSTSFGAVYIPRLDLGPFTVGFSINIPVGFVWAEAFAGARNLRQSVSGLGDVVLTPFMLGYHNGSHFAQARLDVFAPTGEYDADDIAVVGLNYWTFTPTLAYSYIRPGLDVSVNGGIDFNTRNTKTDYTSGTVTHLDASVTLDVGGGFGLGVFGAALYQISDDRGGLANRLDGFRGRSFSVGPLARYAFQLGNAHINANLNWAPEFGVRNRPEGGAVYFRLSGVF
ncbi:transporter [Roseomonas gilardii]|uniref:Transporter n=1 Tax=Roseomonas gilardii TaxID=257708 RepID=A0ABU3MKR9_9PROT|nr:transporter [Roseomonas gilardii]MDT8332920.1 transporter [Roseomonas gilardii]